MFDNENAVNQQLNPRDLMWRSNCINHLNSIQSILSLEMSVSDSESFNLLNPLLEDTTLLRYKFMTLYLKDL